MVRKFVKSNGKGPILCCDGIGIVPLSNAC